MVGIRAVPWLIGLFVLGASLATRVGTHESGAAVSSTLHGSVGPGFVISLTYDDGTAVLTPPPGSYRIVVDDQAADHNFHLIGPGVDMSTGTEQVGSATWTVTLQNNSRYVFQCDTHAAEMNGAFVVGTPTTTQPTSSGTTTYVPTIPTPVGPTTGVLIGSVGGSTATLSHAGKRAASLRGGTYRMTITDSSAKAGFELQRIGFASKSLTTAAFVGHRTTTVRLTTGKWKYYSSARAAGAVVFSVTAK
jgi:hypothetical protein